MGVIDDMRALHAAEDFFTLLDVPCDPEVVRRARLHILKRMGDVIGAGALDGLDEAAARHEARAILLAAHEEFAAAPAIEKRLFKVLVDRDPSRAKKKPARPFVPLSSLFADANAAEPTKPVAKATAAAGVLAATRA